MEQYAVISIQRLPRLNEDEVSEILFDGGAEGVSEDLNFEQLDLRYEPEVVQSTLLNLKAYFSQIPSEAAFLHIQSKISQIDSSAQCRL